MLSFFNYRQQRKLQDEEETPVDTTAEKVGSPRGPGIVQLRLVGPCSLHASERNDARILEWCADSEERIKVSVGYGPDRCVFFIHKNLLRHYSDYFRTALRNDGTPTATPTDREFDFPDADPHVFQRFVRWLYLCRACKKGADTEHGHHHRCADKAQADAAGASWCGLDLEHDYVLGDWLLSRRYCAFVLAHFVAHAGDDTFGLDRVQWILENTPEDSPIQRFARHWVCWLKLRWPGGNSPLDWTRYPDLDAMDAGWAASDPRKFAVGHWETGCKSPDSVECTHRVSTPPVPCGSVDAPSSKMGHVLSSGFFRRRLWDKYQEPLKASLGLLILIVHFLFPFAWVAISAYIIVIDVDPLLFEASKFYSLVVACCAVIMIWPTLMRMVKMYFAVAFSLLVLMASVLSFASSSTCLHGADRDEELSICRMEIGVGVLQFFYALIVGSSYKW